MGKKFAKRETVIKNGIRHTKLFFDRPMQQGDVMGSSTGTTANGVTTTTEYFDYIYNYNQE